MQASHRRLSLLGALLLGGCAAANPPTVPVSVYPMVQAAGMACTDALMARTNARSVTILNAAYAEAASQVLMRDPEGKGSWSCRATNDGRLIDLAFTPTSPAPTPPAPAPARP